MLLLITSSIIAVHGLNPRGRKEADHAWDTWRTPPGPNGHLWLSADLPKRLPDSRVFLYEYDAAAVFSGGNDTFVSKANQLLEAIRVERDSDDTRPILFLGHSMGGLLIKQALINANSNPQYQSIKEVTSGLAFFATPHGGANSTRLTLGTLAAGIAVAAGFQKGDNVLETLDKDSMFSDLMSEHFRHQLLQYDIVSFIGSKDNVST